ncbi:MAG: PAS domain-containing protein [Rhizomicrobium sp.]|jgi:hypothetical protein
MEAMLASDAVAAMNARAIAMGWNIRCYEDLDFVEPELNRLSDIWCAKASRTGFPSRRDFDARTLKPWLPNVSLAERVCDETGTPHFRTRLFGSTLARIFGEQTGRYLDDFLPQPYFERWNALYSTLLMCRKPLRIVARFEWRKVEWLDGEMFATPLGNGHDEPTMILGAMYMTPKPELLMAG